MFTSSYVVISSPELVGLTCGPFSIHSVRASKKTNPWNNRVTSLSRPLGAQAHTRAQTPEPLNATLSPHTISMCCKYDLLPILHPAAQKKYVSRVTFEPTPEISPPCTLTPLSTKTIEPKRKFMRVYLSQTGDNCREAKSQ